MIVDRITENRVYMEDGGTVRPMPRCALPAGIREGDVLVFAGGKWHADAGETEKRRKNIKKRLERLLE